MANEYAKALGAKLRTVRNQQGLSLQGVEASSHGRWKAVVVGSYERGDRAVTVQRLADLAEFYGVPMAELLPDPPVPPVVEPPARLILDLERLGMVPDERVRPLARFVAAIQAMRGADDARLMAIRQDDLRTLGVLYDEPPGQLAEQLVEWGVLQPDPRPMAG